MSGWQVLDDIQEYRQILYKEIDDRMLDIDRLQIGRQEKIMFGKKSHDSITHIMYIYGGVRQMCECWAQELILAIRTSKFHIILSCLSVSTYETGTLKLTLPSQCCFCCCNKKPRKNNLGEKGVYFSPQLQVMVNHCEEVKEFAT